MYLIYMYKQDSALDNPQGLICHKTQPTKLMIRSQFIYWNVLLFIHFLISFIVSSFSRYTYRFRYGGKTGWGK